MSALCDCPAATSLLGPGGFIGRHDAAEHRFDCHDHVCGACWACAARLIIRRQVLTSRGAA